METIRQRLSRKRQRLYFGTVIGVPCFIVGLALFAVNLNLWFLALGLTGFASMILLSVVYMFRVRCPACGSNLGYAVSWPATLTLSISEKIKFCQFCGVSLDAEAKR
jgi:hypothetical protein